METRIKISGEGVHSYSISNLCGWKDETFEVVRHTHGGVEIILGDGRIISMPLVQLARILKFILNTDTERELKDIQMPPYKDNFGDS